MLVGTLLLFVFVVDGDDAADAAADVDAVVIVLVLARVIGTGGVVAQ